MATVVYTSGAPSPKASQVPVIVDLSATPLPIASVQLYGDAEDTGDPLATFTWQWTIASKPAGSSCAFIGASTNQNCVIGPLDVFGNYLVFLEAVSSGPGGASPDKYPLSPKKAFGLVVLEEATLGLVKPAVYERDTQGWYYDLVDALIATRAALTGQTIAQHADVVSATGPLIDQLVDGSLAVNGGSDMHTHRGSAIAVATTTTAGVSKVSDTPADALNPVALNNDRAILCALIQGYESSLGYVAGKVGIAAPFAGSYKALARFYIPTSLTLETFAASVENGGSGTTSLQLFMGNAAAWLAGTPTAISAATLNLTPGSAGAPAQGSVSPVGVTLTGGQWLGIVCTAEAATYLCGPITAVVSTLRKV